MLYHYTNIKEICTNVMEAYQGNNYKHSPRNIYVSSFEKQIYQSCLGDHDKAVK